MNTNSNKYTFIFSIILVVVIGTSLAFAAVSLQPLQHKNVKQAKMQSILSTVGIITTRPEAPAKYKKYIIDEIVLNAKGEVVEGKDAFKIDLAKQMDKPVSEQLFPLFVAEVNGKKLYIVPLRGAGLWGPIWGYISLKSDLNTVAGTVYNHASETPGLGAEIVKDYFQNKFVNEKIFTPEGKLVGVKVVKGYSQPKNNDDHKVDSISGATITSDGVSNMIKERLSHYVTYFKSLENFKA